MGQHSKKGFRGHKVNPPGQGKRARRPDFFPPEMTNHDKMIFKKEQREARRNESRTTRG